MCGARDQFDIDHCRCSALVRPHDRIEGLAELAKSSATYRMVTAGWVRRRKLSFAFRTVYLCYSRCRNNYKQSLVSISKQTNGTVA